LRPTGSVPGLEHLRLVGNGRLALLTAVAMGDGDIQGCDADDDIEGELDAREFDENEIDDVPVRLEESAQADETPIEGSDPDENRRYLVKNLHMIMQK
jgi:hypothetical protein